MKNKLVSLLVIKLKMEILQTIFPSFSYLETILLFMMDDRAFLDMAFMFRHQHHHSHLAQHTLRLSVEIT